MIRRRSYRWTATPEMVRFWWGGTLWCVSLLFFAAATVLLMGDRSGTVLWCIAMSLLHEAGHYAAMRICGARPARVVVGVFGARMELAGSVTVGYRRNIVISLAGPLINAVAAALLWLGGVRGAPVLAGAAMAGLNLLPIEPLDGGQALLFGLCLYLPSAAAERVSLVISAAVLFPLAAAGGWLWLRSGCNFTLFGLCVYLAAYILLKRKS